MRLILICFLFGCTHMVFGQGCSDAGFCTMGAMKPDQPYNKKINLKLRSMELSFYRGTTALTPVISVITSEFNFSLNSRNSFQLKVPYQMVSGSLGQTSGIGDLSLCATRSLISSEKFDLNFSLGTKIPTNNADKTEAGNPLPMYYQTSLGTYDAIAGISFITRKWLFATGIQHPFNKNKNGFKWDQWPDYPNQAYIEKYAPAVDLKRGTDIMLRIERNFRFSQFNFTIGLLPIYRLNRDEITKNGARVKVEEGRGLAMSGLISGGYQFNARTGVKFLVGHKLVQREKNPDGLTRELVTSIGYFYRF